GWAWAVVVFPRVYHPARVFDRAAACCPLPPVGLPWVGPVLGPLDLVCPDLDCPGPACPDLGFCPDLDFYPGPDPSDPDLRPACPVVAVVALPAFFWPGPGCIGSHRPVGRSSGLPYRLPPLFGIPCSS